LAFYFHIWSVAFWWSLPKYYVETMSLV